MAVDSQWANVTLLLPMEGANNQTIITDVKGHVVTVSNGAALSTAVGSPFGAGTAAGAWDTSDNRDLAIATINNLKTRVDQLETKLQALGLLT